MTEERTYVVVVFSTGPDGWCSLSHGPMHAHGPYTSAEAEAASVRFPDWMQPHILHLDADNDSCRGRS